MENTASFSPERRIHTRIQSVVFQLKATVLRFRRGAQNLFDRDLGRFGASDALAAAPVVGDSKTPLWTESDPRERFLLAGKAQNLRVAAKKFDGVVVPAGRVFSFWRQLGRASRINGFVVGRELREGCIVPNIGGGLCQLSNALYDAALQAGLEIVERHAHTQVIPGSLAERGRDATVFWNYVDLRLRSTRDFRVEVSLGRDHLRVRLRMDGDAAPQALPLVQIGGRKTKIEAPAPNGCATCGVESCFRSLKADANLGFGRTAFLLDEQTPEFARYVAGNHEAKDLLDVPLDGGRFGKPAYAWPTEGFAKTRQSLVQTLLRSYRSRRLAQQGAERQRALIASAAALAESYARRLPFDATHLVVSQNLLPHLWRSGALGGRTFDVLMSAFPMTEIQRRLDAAFALHPESPTLGDFRADEALVAAETEALDNARRIVTPHSAIASLFGDRAIRIDWQAPALSIDARTANAKPTFVVPAPTAGRKGAYEIRAALRGLDAAVVTLGSMLEGDGFWDGFDHRRGTDADLASADAVLLPAFVEHRPRRLLAAAAAGIPVIASDACGIAGVDGVTIVAAGDSVALGAAMSEIVAQFRPR